MQRVDRLLAKAKKAAQSKAERFFMGFVEQDLNKGKWIAMGDLSTGKEGGGRRITTEHDSEETAVAALNALAAEYPNHECEPIIFIDDMHQ